MKEKFRHLSEPCDSWVDSNNNECPGPKLIDSVNLSEPNVVLEDLLENWRAGLRGGAPRGIGGEGGSVGVTCS